MSGLQIQSSNEQKFFENLEWMNTEDAARYLRRSVGQIRNMVYRGQITFRKFNSRLYFRKSDLNRVIEFSNNGGPHGNK
jgi:hypothetical protein